MSAVTDGFIQRWRSGDHTGVARPLVFGFVRRGHFERGYLHTNNPLDVHIPGSSPSQPWRARWHPDEEFTVLPNILSYNIEQDFEQNGIHSASIVIENIIYKETASPFGGIYHLIERGYLAPLRGYDGGSPIPTAVQRRNEWFQRLASNVEILLVSGYGGEVATVFSGLTDDIDLSSRPDRITITARDFGQTLTDQKLFGYNKDPHIRDPVTFADNKKSDDTTYEAGGARASSTFRGHPASNVVDKGADARKTEWWSENRGAGNITQWVQITVPSGRYESLYLDVPYPNMEVFIGIYGYAQRGKDGFTVIDGESNREFPEGWYNPDGSLPIVPGEHGDWPYFKQYPDFQHNGKQVPLGRSFHLGPNSKIRVGFRNLYKVRDNHGHADDDYRAGVRRLYGVKRVENKQLKDGQAILVNDVSDIVKVVLRWAGFEEWEVQDTGTRLGAKAKEGAAPTPGGSVTYNRGTFLIDIIKDIADKTGFVFHMREPGGIDTGSIGIPVFRQTASIQDNAVKGVLRDTDVLTGVQAKITDEPLATIIRVRGKEAARKAGGTTLGSESTLRLTASYRPPWTRNGRLAGLDKHVNVNRYDLDTPEALRFACILIALYEALESTTAIVEVAGTPQFELNDQVVLADQGTGLNTRLWVARRSMAFTAGESTSWKSTIGGSLIDTPDIAEIKQDIVTLFNTAQTAEATTPTGIGSRPQVTTHS